MEAINIRNLFSSEPLPLNIAQAFMTMGVSSEMLKREGVTVSVRVPYPMWCNEEKAKPLNTEAYESIMQHEDLFFFVRAYGAKSLEDLKESPYSSWYLWIKIKDRMGGGQNTLILTHGHAPDRQEAFYRAKDYDDFWNTVRRLTEMYDLPNGEFEPICLKQNNGMCGSSFKQWEIYVN